MVGCGAYVCYAHILLYMLFFVYIVEYESNTLRVYTFYTIFTNILYSNVLNTWRATQCWMFYSFRCCCYSSYFTVNTARIHKPNYMDIYAFAVLPFSRYHSYSFFFSFLLAMPTATTIELHDIYTRIEKQMQKTKNRISEKNERNIWKFYIQRIRNTQSTISIHHENGT